ncbi:MAG: peroxiredoxin [Sporichthyaceae bacterium]|jgi:peroxiredoxin
MDVGADSIAIGAKAPDFSLAEQHGPEISLAELRGKAVLLVFYPLAFTGICAGELNLIQTELEAFQNDDVQVLGISVDSKFTQRVFADQNHIEFPLLSDFWPHGGVARAYGVFNDDQGVAYRASFLIDAEGVIRWKVVNDLSHPRDQAAYHEAIAAL